MGTLEATRNEVLGDFRRIANDLGLQHVVIGAGARVLLSLAPKLDPGRLTTDWDLAVPCNDWLEFDDLVQALANGPDAPFSRTQIVHRLEHRGTKVKLDLIPFGGVEHKPGEIVWEDGTEFDVMGLDAALTTSDSVALDEDSVNVASFPSQALLKATAYLQRRERGMTHDVIDLVWILEQYREINEVRVFGEAWATIESNDIEEWAWGTALIGQDIRASDAVLVASLREVLQELLDPDSTAMGDATRSDFSFARDDRVQKVRELARAALHGLDADLGDR